MSNVLYEPLPTTWRGYHINSDFQVGVQISVCFDDTELSDEEKYSNILYLLFSEDGELKEIPEDWTECLTWFMGGWNHDKTPEHEEKVNILDYTVDQGRIYADFRQIYGINLNDCEPLHWWEFQWLLWSMPRKLSSFMQVLEIRTKKPSKNASSEERKAISEAQKIYGLEKPKEYTEKEKTAIDDFDSFMNKAKEQSSAEKEALNLFRKE